VIDSMVKKDTLGLLAAAQQRELLSRAPDEVEIILWRSGPKDRPVRPTGSVHFLHPSFPS
jgi:hypothetical protein